MSTLYIRPVMDDEDALRADLDAVARFVAGALDALHNHNIRSAARLLRRALAVVSQPAPAPSSRKFHTLRTRTSSVEHGPGPASPPA